MWWEAERYAEYMGEGPYDERPVDDDEPTMTRIVEPVVVPPPEPLIEDQPEEECPF